MSENTAAVLQRRNESVPPMSRERSLIHYVLAVAAFRKWLEHGLISEAEFREIEAAAADRHGLPQNSIYR